MSEAPALATCDSCGLSSPVTDAFIKRRGRFGRRLLECPACATRRLQGSARRELVWIMVFLLIGIIGAVAGSAFGWLLLNFVLIQLCLVLMIGPHELGHLLAARAAGLSAPAVVIGVGRRVAGFHAMGARWAWHILPFGGATVVGDRGLGGYRWRYWLAVIAGPALSAVAMLILWVIGVRWHDMVTLGRGLDPLADLAWANLLILILNLVPIERANVFGQRQGTDGRLLLTVPFMSKQKLDEQRAASSAAEALFKVMDDQAEEALPLVHDALKRHPDNFHVRNVLGVTQLALGQFIAAKSTFAELWEAQDDPKFRAIMASNLAWANALIGDPELIEEADRLSEEAMAVLPWIAAVRSTRGLALACSGRAEEALELLKSAWLQEEEPGFRATMMLSMAYAYTLLGKSGDADALLQAVEKSGQGSFEIENLLAKIIDARARLESQKATA